MTPTEQRYTELSQRLGDELLAEFDALCERAGARYVLFAGTLLGAVRHRGWIPWDDDVDVAMLREDFERLRLVAPQLVTEGYRFSDLRSDPAHITPIPRLLHLNTERAAFARERTLVPPETVHVPLDIFVLDAAPTGSLRNALWRARIRLLEKMVVARGTSIKSAATGVAASLPQRVVETVAAVLARFASPRRWRDWHSQECARYAQADPAFVCSTNDFKVATRAVMIPYRHVAALTEVEFAGRTRPGPTDAQGLLGLLYGADFMLLPPADQQRPIHFREGLRASIDGELVEVLPDA